MTIRDLVEQGVHIQGAYQIKKYDDTIDLYEMLAFGSEFEDMNQAENEDVLDMEITYIYAMPKASGYGVEIIFEVE